MEASHRNTCVLKLLFSKKCTSLFTFLAQTLSSSAQQGHLCQQEWNNTERCSSLAVSFLHFEMQAGSNTTRFKWTHDTCTVINIQPDFSVVQNADLCEEMNNCNYVQRYLQAQTAHSREQAAFWKPTPHHKLYLVDQTLETFICKQWASGKLIYQFCIFFWMKDFRHFPVFTSWSCRLGTPAVPSLAAAKETWDTVGMNLLHHDEVPSQRSTSNQTGVNF